MPITLKSPLKTEYQLIKSDEELGSGDGATTVTIRQATQGAYELVNKLTETVERQYDGATVKMLQKISFDDIHRKQIYLTLCGCNIMDETGQTPLFKFKDEGLVNENEFTKAWGKLPPVIANEILEKVWEMNPLWSETLTKTSGKEELEKLGNVS